MTFSGMRSGAWARLLSGVAVLAFLLWRLGAGPFLDGARAVDATSLLAAACIGAMTTAGCAWRWHLVASGLGVDVTWRAGVAACYRSQFLNTVLPGGVLGDVHRGVSHGRDAGDMGRGLRTVVWERSAGQVVQVALTITVLLLLPSPVSSAIPVVASAVAVVGVIAVVGTVVLGRRLRTSTPSRWSRALRTAGSDLRDGVLAQRSWPGIVLASTVVVSGHTATFLIAARTAGSSAGLEVMLPIALVVLLAMAVPTNIGGWGAREGVAAWAFAATGLTAGLGVAASVVYGVMTIVSTLPGALVLAASSRHRRSRAPDPGTPDPVRPPAWRVPTAVRREGARNA